MAASLIVVICASAGCASTKRRDFYAIRSVRIPASVGDGSTIVRAEPADLLTRERQALALRGGD